MHMKFFRGENPSCCLCLVVREDPCLICNTAKLCTLCLLLQSVSPSPKAATRVAKRMSQSSEDLGEIPHLSTGKRLTYML